jgi:hypothetical protein
MQRDTTPVEKSSPQKTKSLAESHAKIDLISLEKPQHWH